MAASRSAIPESGRSPRYISPSVGLVSLATRCRTVLLPDPLGPMMVQNCRAGICSESPRKASTRVWPSPKTLLTLSNRIIGAWGAWGLLANRPARRPAPANAPAALQADVAGGSPPLAHEPPPTARAPTPAPLRTPDPRRRV